MNSSDVIAFLAGFSHQMTRAVVRPSVGATYGNSSLRTRVSGCTHAGSGAVGLDFALGVKIAIGRHARICCREHFYLCKLLHLVYNVSFSLQLCNTCNRYCRHGREQNHSASRATGGGDSEVSI